MKAYFDGEKFRIIQFTDMHLTRFDEADKKSVQLVNNIIQAVEPDYVMYTGDIITGENDADVPLTQWIVEETDKYNIPWSFSMGNHEQDRSAIVVSEELMKAKNINFEIGPDLGGPIVNYTVNIYDKKTDLPLWVFYIINSNCGRFYRENGEMFRTDDYIHAKQIEWYKKTNTDIKSQYGDIPALAFIHIPLPEYRDGWMFGQCVGDRFEKVYHPPINSGFFHACYEEGNMKGIFCGHDHVMSYYTMYHDIMLAYGRCSSYHCKCQNKFLRGGSIIDIYKDGRVEKLNVFDTPDGVVIEDNPVVTNPPFAKYDFYISAVR